MADKTRPDISFAVNFFARWLKCAGPREEKWQSLHYLRKTPSHGIVFYSPEHLKPYSAADSDFAGDPNSSRSTLGNFYKLGEFGMIVGTSKLDRPIHTSVGSAETSSALRLTRIFFG